MNALRPQPNRALPTSADMGSLATPEPTYDISIALSVNSTHWTRVRTTWPALIDALPDYDCWLGGTLSGQERARETVEHRTVWTLDEDDARDLLGRLAPLEGVAFLVHETKSSTPEAPRARLAGPLSRSVTPDEYWRIMHALMDSLDHGKDRAGALAEQLMFGPEDRRVVAHDGEPLDVDYWLTQAKVTGIPGRAGTSADVAAWDGAPPTAKQCDKAQTILRKYVRQMENLVNENTGEMWAGRNAALISMLPMLYRFVASDSLAEEDVYQAMWDAVQAVEGGHPFTEAEYRAVTRRAKEYAETDGPAVPWVETAVDVFTPVPMPALGTDPSPYFGVGGLRVADLVADIRDARLLARDALDPREFWVYDHGVWRVDGDQEVIGGMVVDALVNRFKPDYLRNVMAYLSKKTDVRKMLASPTPGCLNVQNGMLDWRTGDLLPHSPDFMSVTQFPVAWDPEADCPEVEKFLREVLPRDCLEPMEGGPGFIWEVLAYLLYSGNPHHIAMLLYGDGRNGKGSLLRMVERLVGRENITAVTLHSLTGNRFAATALYGKALNVAGDLDATYLPSTATFKGITGEDTIQGERKFGAVFSFRPFATPVYSINGAFGAADGSQGYIDRWVVVPFPNSFSGNEDRGLGARLQTPEELRGVLRRAVEALPAVMERGRLPRPESVIEAKQKFVTRGDAVRGWLAETCEVGDLTAWTPQAVLLDRYEWDHRRDKNRLSRNKFYDRIEQIPEVTRTKRQGVWGFRGLRLLPVTNDEFDDDGDDLI